MKLGTDPTIYHCSSICILCLQGSISSGLNCVPWQYSQDLWLFEVFACMYAMHGTYKVTSHNFTMTLCTVYLQHATNLHVLGTCTFIVTEYCHTITAVSAEDGVVTSLNSTFPITLTWGTKASSGTNGPSQYGTQQTVMRVTPPLHPREL